MTWDRLVSCGDCGHEWETGGEILPGLNEEIFVALVDLGPCSRCGSTQIAVIPDDEDEDEDEDDEEDCKDGETEK